jgi:hypothetical protein
VVDLTSVFIFGGLFFMVGAYVIAISSRWQRFRRAGDVAIWVGFALVLIAFHQLRFPR